MQDFYRIFNQNCELVSQLPMVAKKEVGDIPFLKQVFACMKAFIIDREELKQSMQVIVNVIREVQAGRNYLKGPEVRMETIRERSRAEVLRLRQRRNARLFLLR